MSTNDLDQSAAELGMGGKLAPETDDAGYRKRMEPVSYTHLTLPTTPYV